MRDEVIGRAIEAEPLVRISDLEEYRRGLARRLSGEWDEERFTAFRVRFGVYGQRQPNVQMIRIKIPGGIVPTGWLRAIAAVNRDFAQGDAHITTRQDVQIYSVPLERTAEALETLYSAGLTTREACGNTLRNVTACALSGICPHERVDAGQTAERIARAWLRAPLVQHMPRKVKMSVSGCAADCGASAIHDLSFVAREDGFAVYAGGGLGSSPRPAVQVLEHVTEKELPAVVEALARLHQRYSNRVNRNAARVKFLVKRFGEQKFIALFREEFDAVRGLPQRPWDALEWKQPTAGAGEIARTPVGLVQQRDGRVTIIPDVPLGILSSDQLEALADIAETEGLTELRTTRDQNIVLPGLAAERADGVVAALARLGLRVPAQAEEFADVISCPGTTTCRIGITNSQSLGRELLGAVAPGIAVRISGCQNSCGLHHLGDFGLHGMAKKLDGRTAPHYQLHLGGGQEIALSGPVVPARLAPQALTLLQDGYRAGRHPDESVRGWAERLGKDGLAALLRPLDGFDGDGLFVDWGEAVDFTPPPPARGDCAAPFAADLFLADLADDALICADRSIAVGRAGEAVTALAQAAAWAARRLQVLHQGASTPEEVEPEPVLAAAQGLPLTDDLRQSLAAVRVEHEGALGSGELTAFREAVALWLDAVREAVIAPPAIVASAGAPDLSAFSEL
jgi:sulfite reductase (NADPH) hemoprotein beta-component